MMIMSSAYLHRVSMGAVVVSILRTCSVAVLADEGAGQPLPSGMHLARSGILFYVLRAAGVSESAGGRREARVRQTQRIPEIQTRERGDLTPGLGFALSWFVRSLVLCSCILGLAAQRLCSRRQARARQTGDKRLTRYIST
ncbi:hypothetical protein BDW74DRAFT_148307 [Aspergillus multicolor]|uniref:uncharacterized protein n=1 Tax=Aspergillus multicolor TaxID=41759 RepID=UPI003CCCE766